MLFLPLGLGTKLPRTPWVTIGITFFLLMAFVLDKSPQRMNAALLKIRANDKAIERPMSTIFTQHCIKKGLNRQECLQMSSVIVAIYRGDGKAWQSLFKPGVKRSVMELRSRTIQSFLNELRKPSTAFKELPAYKGFTAANQSTTRKIAQVHRRENSLTKANITPLSLGLSQTRHGGWMHLIGNLAILILFGMYAEARMGSGTFLLAYIASGTFGMWFQTKFFLEPGIALLGASANIMGTVGLFYALFFSARMRFFTWLGTSRILAVPVKITIPLLYLASDLMGGLVSTEAFGGNASGVGHFAHLGGFVLGCALAYVYVQQKPLPSPLLLREEGIILQQLSKVQDKSHKLAMAQQVLAYNPDNTFARFAILEILLTSRDASSRLNAGLMNLIRENTIILCQLAVHRKQFAQAAQILSALPQDLQAASYIPDLGPSNVLKLGEFAVWQGNHRLALILYESYLMSWPNSITSPALRLSVSSLKDAMNSTMTMQKEAG